MGCRCVEDGSIIDVDSYAVLDLIYAISVKEEFKSFSDSRFKRINPSFTSQSFALLRYEPALQLRFFLIVESAH